MTHAFMSRACREVRKGQCVQRRMPWTTTHLCPFWTVHLPPDERRSADPPGYGHVALLQPCPLLQETLSQILVCPLTRLQAPEAISLIEPDDHPANNGTINIWYIPMTPARTSGKATGNLPFFPPLRQYVGYRTGQASYPKGLFPKLSITTVVAFGTSL